MSWAGMNLVEKQRDPLTYAVIGAAIEVHRALGPGLMESAYEECLRHELFLRALLFKRQVPIPLVYKEIHLECAYYADIVVADGLVLELKAVESLAKIHEAQLLTYMKLLGIKKGLLVNFHAPVLKDGILRRVL